MRVAEHVTVLERDGISDVAQMVGIERPPQPRHSFPASEKGDEKKQTAEKKEGCPGFPPVTAPDDSSYRRARR
jgi:hypothetical protein